MKAGFEARARARREKEREKEAKEREERREEEEREMDLAGWSRKLRQEQEVWHVVVCTLSQLNAAVQALMVKIKDRARRKAALTDRKSAAAQARMKNIASLAADDRVSKAKKRKGDRGTFVSAYLGRACLNSFRIEDMFGADDADWAIYRKIVKILNYFFNNRMIILLQQNTAAPDSDEEDDLSQLQVIEQKLLAHDPTFTAQQTHASITTQRSALMSAFRPFYSEGDIEGASWLSTTRKHRTKYD